MKKDGAVGMQINCVSNLIRRSIDLRIAGMPGEKLSRMDSWIIHYMLDHQQEDVFQKDVEKALAMTRSNVSKAVDQMVSKGLIMRSPVDYDARLKKLTLTPKVLEIHRQIEGEIAEFEKLLVEGFTTRELEQFKDYLARIAHNINDNTKRQQDASRADTQKCIFHHRKSLRQRENADDLLHRLWHNLNRQRCAGKDQHGEI